MKFFCEYCGNRIDSSKDSKCPNCGASYKKNKSFIEMEKERKQQQQMVQDNTQKVFKHVFGVFKFSWIFFLLPVIVFIVIIIIAVSVSLNKPKTENKLENDLNKAEDLFNNLGKEEQENVVVNFDEFAITKKYKVKVNKYEVVEDRFNKLDEDYEYVKFHLIVENTTDKNISSEDVNCIVDGIAQNNYYYSGHSELPFTINKGLAVKGTATFEVPKSATSYDIRYGDYVTIHIKK